MKKLILISSLLFFLTGCAEKTEKCEYIEECGEKIIDIELICDDGDLGCSTKLKLENGASIIVRGYRTNSSGQYCDEKYICKPIE